MTPSQLDCLSSQQPRRGGKQIAVNEREGKPHDVIQFQWDGRFWQVLHGPQTQTRQGLVEQIKSAHVLEEDNPALVDQIIEGAARDWGG